LKKGETATNITQIYGVGKLTVNERKRDDKKIGLYVSHMQTNDGVVKSRKTKKPAKYEQLDNDMYEWFIQARSQGVSLSDSIIMTKTGEINIKLNNDTNFKASIVLQVWNSIVVAEIKERFKLKKQCDLKLVREEVYNCDEIRLN
jgi:hypothetical protein